MKYNVIFSDPADNELAAAWLKSSDRNAVTDLACHLEQQLSRDPFKIGEGRESPLDRIFYGDPLGMYFGLFLTITKSSFIPSG